MIINSTEMSFFVQDIFDEYLREREPQEKEKGYAWYTAIGLQAVDGLETSEYLIDTAKKNIEGDITFEEANQLIHSYYKENVKHNSNDRTEEADKVSVRIILILKKGFTKQQNSLNCFWKTCF